MSFFMRYMGIMIITVLLSSQALAVEDKKNAVEKADLEKQISYAIGYDIFEKLKNTVVLDPDFFFMGAKDSNAGTPQVSDEKIREILMSYQRIARQKQIEQIKMESDKNKMIGSRFLDDNKKKEGVITLSSGLQYQILAEGQGKMPQKSDSVECHYTGTLIDGTVFDSSYKRGEPAVFQVGGVIPGWVEALQKMKVGSKWKLFIPPELAYGDRGAGDIIKPGSTLVFEVELLNIVE